MIKIQKFINELKKNNLNFSTGVETRYLKIYVMGLREILKKNIIAANEGSAVAIGIGYHLSSKKSQSVYMQNSVLEMQKPTDISG